MEYPLNWIKKKNRPMLKKRSAKGLKTHLL